MREVSSFALLSPHETLLHDKLIILEKGGDCGGGGEGCVKIWPEQRGRQRSKKVNNMGEQIFACNAKETLRIHKKIWGWLVGQDTEGEKFTGVTVSQEGGC